MSSVDDILAEVSRELGPKHAAPAPRAQGAAGVAASKPANLSAPLGPKALQIASVSSAPVGLSAKVSEASIPSQHSTVDSLLSELESATGRGQQVSSHRASAASVSGERPPAAAFRQKCAPGPVVGGTGALRGLSREGEACCDRLRCTKCDHRVVERADCAWDASTDYIFVRNYYPHWEQLRDRLSRRPGAVAYTCQCTWETVEGTVYVADLGHRWVCGGHQP